MTDVVDAQFWPRWPHQDGRFTEPDVALRWPGALVSVAVNYLSGKSGAAKEDRDTVTDQLVLAQRIAATEGRAWAVPYLPADAACPRRCLSDSLSEVRVKRTDDLPDGLTWTGWSDVRAGFGAWTATRKSDARLRDDIVRYLTRLGFVRIDGVMARPLPPPPWRFAPSGLRWPAIPTPTPRRFSLPTEPGAQ